MTFTRSDRSQEALFFNTLAGEEPEWQLVKDVDQGSKSTEQ